MAALWFQRNIIRRACLIGVASGGLGGPQAIAQTYFYDSGPLPLTSPNSGPCPNDLNFWLAYDSASGQITASLLGNSNVIPYQNGVEFVDVVNGAVTSWGVYLEGLTPGSRNWDFYMTTVKVKNGGRGDTAGFVYPFPGANQNTYCPYAKSTSGSWTLAGPPPTSPITKQMKTEYGLLAADLQTISTALDVASIISDQKNIVRNMEIWTSTQILVDQVSKNDEIFGQGVELSIGATLFARELYKTPRLFKANRTAIELEALSLIAGFVSIFPEVLADDPPDLNFTAVEPPQKLSFPKTGNKTLDNATTDYLTYVSLSAAELHAAERYQGAGMANNEHFENLQLKAFNLYAKMATAMKAKLNADNLALSQRLPVVNITSFPGGANAIAAAFNAQCGQRMSRKINNLLLSLRMTQSEIDSEVCNIDNSVTPPTINPDFQPLLSAPLP